jgi:hypothetical protein
LPEKWRAVSINNKLIVVFAGLTMIATVVYSGFSGWRLYEIHSTFLIDPALSKLVPTWSSASSLAGLKASLGLHQEYHEHDLPTLLVMSRPVAVGNGLVSSQARYAMTREKSTAN